MDNNPPPSLTLEDAFDLIHDLREEVARHEQLLEKLTEAIQQEPEAIQQEPEAIQQEPEAIQQEPAWEPSRNVKERIQPSSNIRKVLSTQTKPHDSFTRLRNTWLGQLYIKHLKRYALVRSCFQWAWRNGYPFYVNHIATRAFNRKTKKWYPLIKLGDYAKKREISTYKLVDSAIVETPVPNVFPVSDQSYLVSPHDRYNFPEIYVAKIENAMVYGGTNLILTEDEVVCHDVYNFERDYTSEELHGRTLIDPKLKRIRWLFSDEAPELIPIAATFVDACALNYAHWMTEVLPRVALFCTEEQFKDVPVVVNEGLHQNIMESLFWIAGADREIITLETGRTLAVNKLFVTSVAGYVPFEPRKNNLLNHSHGLFSPNALKIMCNQLNIHESQKEKQNWPEKIYIRRTSGIRKVTNTDEIEKLLVARGYAIIEPELLTFSQQVKLFSNAKSIVGPSGAALSNLLFAPENTKICILISKFPDMYYWYWQNMACASGKEINYVFGEVRSDSRGVHSDFIVDCNDLLLSIDEAE